MDANNKNKQKGYMTLLDTIQNPTDENIEKYVNTVRDLGVHSDNIDGVPDEYFDNTEHPNTMDILKSISRGLVALTVMAERQGDTNWRINEYQDRLTTDENELQE